jgi:hypothetical protein
MKTEWTNEPKKFDLNPSDKKLREMIAEKDDRIATLEIESELKDAEIARLKAGWSASGSREEDQIAEIIRLKKASLEQLDLTAEITARNKSLESQLNAALAKLNQAEIQNAINTKDAERYRKLKPLFHKSAIMSNNRRWWDCHITTEPDIASLNDVIDLIPEVQS